jgi:hypothetical protein
VNAPEIESFRLLVTGSRDATAEHRPFIREQIMLAIGHIRASDLQKGKVVLVHGNQRGVDLLAAEIVRGFVWPIGIEPWDARNFGKWPSAGPRRNAHMVSLGADVCLAFPLPGSRGTWNCAELAVNAGIPTILRSLRGSTGKHNESRS